jgi:predicted O-methyltransferase YrrM
MSKIKLASDQVIFVKGDVKDTLSRKIPINIALLRLDTDFYESTKLELEILYPLVSSGGAVLVDDYGAWAGSQIATDEYRRINNINSYLNIIDNESRLFFKP